MPKNAFLHKKSLLDTFRDDYKVTNPIKAARAERTWENPIVRHKREREINKWAHSFAGKKHFRKLTRFNATREANESCRVLYPLEDVVKVVTDALRTIRTRIYQVDGYYQFIQDKLQYGMVVAKDIAHRDFPYRWEVQANLVTRLKKGNEIVMEYHPDTPEELSEYLQEEGAIEPNEAKMKISIRKSKKNEKDGERTLMTAWTYLERLGNLEGEDSRKEATAKLLTALGNTQGTEGRWYDGDGDEIDIIDELDNAEWDFAVKTCGPLQESKKDEGRAQCDLCGADMDEDDYDMHGGKCRGCRGPEKEPQGKWIVYLDGKEQGSYKTEPEARDAYKACVGKGDCYYTFKPSGKFEDLYKGKDRGFLVLVQKLIADNWYASAHKEFPGLTLDCYEMDGAGDDMKICFEAYGEEIDDPMSEGLMEIAEESAKKGCADANRSTDPSIADYGLEANFISWDEPDVFRDQWGYVINLSSKPKGKKGEGYGGTKSVMSIWGNRPRDVYPEVSYSSVNDMYNTLLKYGYGDKHPIYYKNNSPEQIKGHILGYFKWTPTNSDADIEADALAAATMIKNNFNKSESKEPADEKLGYEKGHKNSKGELAPWVIRSHEDNRVLASFANKDDAYAHLQRMKQYSKSEGLENNGVIVVPEWLWVAYETGDSSNLSVEEEQILDGFRAMAAGKVFDAEAEPSFRAFNDFDDYAGNCYEVQVYTIKESK